jgi:hypothetical protein
MKGSRTKELGGVAYKALFREPSKSDRCPSETSSEETSPWMKDMFVCCFFLATLVRLAMLSLTRSQTPALA